MREYIVTYTTFDKKTRRVKGVVLYNDEKVIDKVVEFVETKKWPEEPFDYTVRKTEWGLALFEHMGVSRHGNQLQFPNETQAFYCQRILQHGIVDAIAVECCRDAAFGEALLKEAMARAIKKDENRVANLLASGYKKENIHPNAYQDALNRAKKRIRYHQKPVPYGAERGEFRRVIEEFELFTVRKIKLREYRR